MGQDRSIEEVCRLINKPRSKKEAKLYYKIESDEVNYQAENEDSVSEVEIQNILTHYKRLGNNEERYIESFNNIAAQYNDAQLRVIASILPLKVKAVLETESEKYQSIMTFGEETYNPKVKDKKVGSDGSLKMGFIENSEKRKVGGSPVVVPSTIDKSNVKKLFKKTVPTQKEENESIENNVEESLPSKRKIEVPEIDIPEVEIPQIEVPTIGNKVEPIKKGRGRPKKNVTIVEEKEEKPKKRRGRPKKVSQEDLEILPEVEEDNKEDILSGFDDERIEEEKTLPGFDDEEEVEEEETSLPGFDDEEEVEEEETSLPGFDDEEEVEEETSLPGFDDEEEVEEETSLPGFDDEEEVEEETSLPGFDDEEEVEEETSLPGFDDEEEVEEVNFEEPEKEIYNARAQQKSTPIYGSSLVNGGQYKNSELEINNLITKDKKIVTFVGTTKNGTSFLVNNLAKLFSDMGVKTAILDVTKNRNSYYIYTKNEEILRKKAFTCIEKLRNGKPEGIAVNKNLTVYTALPDEENEIEDVENILSTLVKNYSLILIDSDFSTPVEYFKVVQEIYLVQSLDVLTIQPLTAFLRELKSKNVELQRKIKIVINKEQNVRNLSPKAIIGGMAFYNDPAMAFMTELFKKDKVQYCAIPFEIEVYTKYLEGLVNCQISINEYTKDFLTSLKDLGNMVYPMVSSKYRPPEVETDKYAKNNKFSSNMNKTLDQMKNKKY